MGDPQWLSFMPIGVKSAGKWQRMSTVLKKSIGDFSIPFHSIS